jgi:hypothetical protein
VSAYYHGGMPGLRPGQTLVPSPPNYLDDCPICRAKKAGINTAIDPLTVHPDRIYITTDRDYARFYASKFPRGDLYVVEPIGELEPSAEDYFPTWKVTEARVRAVYDRHVQLTMTQRRSLLRRWPQEPPDWLLEIQARQAEPVPSGGEPS